MIRTLTRPAICLLTVSCVACGGGEVAKQESKKQPDKIRMPAWREDPDAFNKTESKSTIIDVGDPHELLKMAADLYQRMNDFEVELTLGWESQGRTKDPREEIYNLRLLAQRPNQFALRGDNFPNVISTGSRRFLYAPKLEKYSEVEAPDNWHDLVTNSELGEAYGHSRPALFDLLCDDAYERLTKDATKVVYAGRPSVGNARGHHIKIFKPDREIELVFALRDKPLLLRAATHHIQKSEPQGARRPGTIRRVPRGKVQEVRRTLREMYENWAVDQKLVAFAFAYSPPQGSSKVSSLVWEFNQSSRSDSGMLSRPAPRIPLPLLDGSYIDLKEHREKQIVLLDLWTSTYPPCIEQLQVVASIAEDYRDQLVLYTINHRERRDASLRFLSNHSLDLSVALDYRGWTAWAYRVRSVPAAVLIDKQGRIRSVHIGMKEDLAHRLRTEIEALLQEDKLDNDLLDRLAVEMPVSELVAALDVPNPRVREKAATVLGQKGGDAVPALVEALKSTNPDVRLWTAVSLERIGEAAAPAAPALLDALLDRDPNVHDAASDALGHIGEPILDVLFEALAEGTVSKRMGASRALGMQSSHADKVIPKLIGALGDRHSLVREAAADGLAALGSKAAKPLTDAIENTTSERVALAAGEALTGMGEEIVPHLLANLKHPNERVRYVSVISLGNIGIDSEEVVAALRSRIAEDNDNVAFYADQALKKLKLSRGS